MSEHDYCLKSAVIIEVLYFIHNRSACLF